MGKRGPACGVCGHSDRAIIDLALARNVSPVALGRKHGLGPDALYRHKKSHLPPQLRAALLAGPDIAAEDLENLRTVESEGLLAHLVALRNRLFAAYDVAEEAGDANMAARVASQLHKNFELVARLVGELASGSTTVNVLLQPVYLELRVGLMQALGPHPEARVAVADVLRQLEGKAAATITHQGHRSAVR